MRDPHQNIFYYYRGPSTKKDNTLYDIQIEDNTTKSFINILELSHDIGFDELLNAFLREISASKRLTTGFRLQKGLERSRPDAVINLSDYTIHIESKVGAALYLDQIKRHLRNIGPQDKLVVITNNYSDRDLLKEIHDSRVVYIRWADLHRICLQTISEIRQDKKNTLIVHLIKQFVNYLEVIVMTDFCGFNDADFDFWVNPNPNYVPILKKKLQAFANIIKENLPGDIANEYSFIKPGNVSRNVKDDRFAWVAIKRPKNNRDIFNQCNFTIEVSRGSLDINAVIRNGRTTQQSTSIGVFYDKLTRNPDGFLAVLKKIKIDASLIISKRLPKTGDRIMPGNERWVEFFNMSLKDISSRTDIDYIRKILEKADAKPSSPGVHVRYSFDRGEKVLADPDQLQEEIIRTISLFRPVLKYLEDN